MGRTSSRPVRISPHLAENHSCTAQHGTTVNKAGQSNAGVSGQDCRQPSLPCPADCVLPASDSYLGIFLPSALRALFPGFPLQFWVLCVCFCNVCAIGKFFCVFAPCFVHGIVSLQTYFASFANMCQQMPWSLNSLFNIFSLLPLSALQQLPFANTSLSTHFNGM